MELFERASNRFISDEERQALTTFVIVGGGPTSIEFSGELHDFIVEDVAKWFPDVKTRVIVIESTDHILGTFDSKLTDYAMNILKSRSEITLKTNTYVKKVTENEVLLSNGEVIPCGITVWSTGEKMSIYEDKMIVFVLLGLSPNELTSSLPFFKEKRSGRIYTNDHLQVLVDDKTTINYIFALGDCATPVKQSLPATAQAAAQQAKYLAKRFNRKEFRLKNSNEITNNDYPAFNFNNLGMLAYLGGYGGLADLKQTKTAGFLSWLLWRSVYMTRLVSFKNRLLV
jgi:NADH dehydrogenase FAD-containing subunit